MSHARRLRPSLPRLRHAAVGFALLSIPLSAVPAAALPVAGASRPAAPLSADKTATEANITQIVTALLADSQFAHHPLDDQLAAKLLDRYLEALDGDRALFLQSDVDEFGAYRAQLSRQLTVAGDARPAHAIFARYLERLRQRVAYETELLKAGNLEFTGHDEFSFDRDKAARPRTIEEARRIWKQALRAEFLQEKLGDKSPPSSEIAKTLTRRHQQRLRTMSGLGADDVLAVYLDALTHVYDPHSDYLGREEMESLSIEMNLSLFGIGASLSNEDGTCTVHALVPGSPAEKSGLLAPGDRIIAVAQAKGDPVDVTDMPLSRIVGLIRGPKGSVVRLTVLPPAGSAGPPRTIQLVRAEIKLEDQQAKARVIDVPLTSGGAVRLGVVDLQSFYSGDGGGRGASADVAKLLTKLKAEQVAGVILDLRKNGGGSLDEAIKLTGLFIKRGPVVQTRDYMNTIQIAEDPDTGVVYDGPLVVLTSRFSASASEIAAGALQDYGRAVIVGDTTTFGKGTVQSIVPLAPVMDRKRLEHAYDPGALKVTISKFYRPSGSSTELRGVGADIVVPSRSEVARVGESELKDPLPWDTVPSAKFDKQDRVAGHLGVLRTRSKARVEADKGFQALRAENAVLKERIAKGLLALNEAERRRDLAQAKERDGEIEREAKAVAAGRKSYLVTVKAAAQAGLPAPEVPDAGAKPAVPGAAPDSHEAVREATAATDDIVLNEALLILSDYARLLDSKPLDKMTAR
jgi:carboxyl-terminal processing protease